MIIKKYFYSGLLKLFLDQTSSAQLKVCVIHLRGAKYWVKHTGGFTILCQKIEGEMGPFGVSDMKFFVHERGYHDFR